jgi:hypothetical protein
MAADFFVVPSVTFRLLFVLIILAHDRRRIVHVAVTEHPTAAWTAQQLRNAFSEHDAPQYLLHDRDSVFADVATTIAGMNTHTMRTAPQSPWQSAPPPCFPWCLGAIVPKLFPPSGSHPQSNAAPDAFAHR